MKKRFLFGEWVNDQSLTVKDVEALCQIGRQRAKVFADYPLDKVFRILEAVGQRWTQKDDPFRKQCLRLLPAATGFSQEMIERGLDELGNLFSPELLQKKLDVELRGVPRQYDSFFDPETGTIRQWQPVGVILHVLAGNVFLGAAGSLLESVITGNVSILKMSSGEKVFLPLLVQSIAEEDKDGILTSSLAVVDYTSAQAAVIDAFKKQVDGIVVWGGEEAVRAYRNDLPARTRLIVFGPKLSFALVTKAGANKEGVASLAEKLAAELAIWDQNACTAPQVCYVEGEETVDALLPELAKALDEVEKRFPAGAVDLNTAVEIRKIRSVEEMAGLRGEGALFASKENLKWTLWKGRSTQLETSPLHRSLSLIPYQNLAEVLNELDPLKGYLQTAGVTADENEFWTLRESFKDAGVVRVLPLGSMAGGEIDDPHDGAYDLPQYLNLVVTRRPAFHRNLHPVEVMPETLRQELINQRLRVLLKRAQTASHYQKMKGLSGCQTVDDLTKLPVLSQDEMRASLPPFSNALGTQSTWQGGYVSRSGGSTGEPKFSIYDHHDWEAMVRNAVRIFYAAGLRPGDRLANCMIAGDLYGSFVSFDHINVLTKVVNFAISHALSAQLLVDLWHKFNMNAIQGIPVAIMPALREAKKIEPNFTVEKILYAGQPIAEADLRWLQNTLGVKRIASVIGANDGGQIAYQCEAMSGAVHHTVDDFNYIEILGDSDERLPDGEPGRIVITSLLKYAYPLIRYDIGDRGRIVPGLCSCGRATRRLEFMGRSGDELSIGLLNVNLRDFDSALSGEEVMALQLVGSVSDGHEIITINIESEDGSEAHRAKLENLMLERVPKLKDRLTAGHLHRFVVTIAKPGTLPRNKRTGKLKRVIDERLKGVT